MNNNKNPKVVFADYSWDYEIERKAFAGIGAEVITFEQPNKASLLTEVRDADIIINSSFPITEEILNVASCCQAVIHSGIGVDSIDVAAATKKGIIISNVTGHCVDEVSDHALTLLLCCARKVIQSNNEIRQGIWSFKKYDPINRLRGSILGIIGYGKIGQSLALKTRVLGMEIIVFDPLIPKDIIASTGVKSVSLEELCGKSDFVSIHCPLTEETRSLIGEKELKLMKRNAYIVNTARGAIIDEKSLITALKEGWIAGAALDVLTHEPPYPENPLLKFKNVILTPHIAFYSEESIKELRKEICDATISILTNHWPKSVINSEVKSNPKHENRKIRLYT